MHSVAIERVVLLTDNNDLCYCDTDFCKVCAVRIANGLPCKKSILRVTDISEEPSDVDDGLDVVRSLDKRLSGITNALSETLRHANRMK
jgi:hypothetical protein